jgi:cytidyltransferase-like protein
LKTILFSGRFDMFHIGHYITIKRLLKKFDGVLIVVLDYKNSMYSITKRMDLIEEVFEGCKEVAVTNFNVHFEKITKEAFNNIAKGWTDDEIAYGSGNHEVLRHVKMLGIDTVYVPRYPGLNASDEMKLEKIKRILDE